MKPLLTRLFLVLLIFTFGCAGVAAPLPASDESTAKKGESSAAPSLSPSQAASSSSSELLGTTWGLIRFQSGDDSVLVSREPARYTISFLADNKMAVKLFCNRGVGTWASSGAPHLNFSTMATTRALCEEDPLQYRLAQDWTAIRSYVLKNGRLYLSLMADGGIYEFETVPALTP